jgi:hypothetical protein
MSIPNFLCVASEHADESARTMFTPKVMKWRDDTWLMDLTGSKRYFSARASRLSIDTEAMLRAMLGECHSHVEGGFCAALADQPWMAALLVAHMKERGMKGLLNAYSQFGQSAYQQLDWGVWLGEAEHMAEFFVAAKVKRFSAATFRKQLKLLKAAVMRLGQKRPQQLFDANEGAMNRRFGGTIALMWEWSRNPLVAPPVLTGFPWIDWTPSEKPQLNRSLDEPLWQWDHLVPLLCEDFDRLCASPLWQRHEKVVSLQWTLQLHNESELEVPVVFRHPHGLHHEIGEHKTALLQTHYAFEQATAALVAAMDLDIPTPIVGWTLLIDKRITLPQTLLSLFGEMGEDAKTSELLALENQLPVALSRFDLCADWLPEESFALLPSVTTPWCDEEQSLPWVELAASRPMFLYQKSEELLGPPHSSGLSFLERTSVKWWRGSKTRPMHRDYYRYLDRKQRVTWVFQDQTGKWVLHGIFA